MSYRKDFMRFNSKIDFRDKKSNDLVSSSKRSLLTLCSASAALFLVLFFIFQAFFHRSSKYIPGSYWSNPELSWYEKLFCRGALSASFCNRRSFNHPFERMRERRNLSMEQMYQREYIPRPEKSKKVVMYQDKI